MEFPLFKIAESRGEVSEGAHVDPDVVLGEDCKVLDSAMVFGKSQIVSGSTLSGSAIVESSIIQRSTVSDSCQVLFASVSDSSISGDVIIQSPLGAEEMIYIDGCTISGSGKITESKHGERIHLEE